MFARPPVIRRLGKKTHNILAERVGEKDRKGFVYAQTKLDLPESLPDWDSFEKPELEQGQIAPIESSFESSFSPDFTCLENENEKLTKARIHRNGSVDILIHGQGPRKERTTSSPKSTHSKLKEEETEKNRGHDSLAREKAHEKQPLTPKRRNPVSLSRTRDKVQEPERSRAASGLERYFESQAQRAQSLSPQEKVPRGASRNSASNMKETPVPDVENRDVSNVIQAGPEHVITSRPPPRKANFGENKFHLEEEKKYWEARKQHLGAQKRPASTPPAPMRSSRQTFEVVNDTALHESLLEAESLLNWFCKEVERFAKHYSSGKKLLPATSAEKMIRFAQDDPDKLEFSDTNEDNHTRGKRLKPLPEHFKHQPEMKQLWCALDDLLYEFLHRDKHHRDVNRECILEVHRFLKRQEKARLEEKLDLQHNLKEQARKVSAEAEAAANIEVAKHQQYQRKLEDEITQLQAKVIRSNSNDAQLEDLQRKNKELQHELKKAQEALEGFKQETKLRFTRRNEKYSQQVSEIRGDADRKISLLKNQIGSLQRELASARDRASAQVATETARQAKANEAFRQTVESKVKRLTAEHTEFVRQLKAEQRETIDALRKEFNMEINMLRQAVRDEEAKHEETKENHAKALARLRVERSAKQQAYELDLARLRQSSRLQVSPDKISRKSLLDLPSTEGLEKGPSSPSSKFPSAPPPVPSALLLSSQPPQVGFRDLPRHLGFSVESSSSAFERPSFVGRGAPSPPPPPPPPLPSHLQNTLLSSSSSGDGNETVGRQQGAQVGVEDADNTAAVFGKEAHEAKFADLLEEYICTTEQQQTNQSSEKASSDFPRRT